MNNLKYLHNTVRKKHLLAKSIYFSVFNTLHTRNIPPTLILGTDAHLLGNVPHTAVAHITDADLLWNILTHSSGSHYFLLSELQTSDLLRMNRLVNSELEFYVSINHLDLLKNVCLLWPLPCYILFGTLVLFVCFFSLFLIFSILFFTFSIFYFSFSSFIFMDMHQNISFCLPCTWFRCKYHSSPSNSLHHHYFSWLMKLKYENYVELPMCLPFCQFNF